METVEVAVVVVVGVEVAEVVWLLACVHSFMCVQCVLWWGGGGEGRSVVSFPVLIYLSFTAVIRIISVVVIFFPEPLAYSLW